MSTQFREAACPRCGDTQGFRYVRIERSDAYGKWGGEIDDCDGHSIERTMPECLGCGHKFRWSSLQAAFARIGGAS